LLHVKHKVTALNELKRL